LGYSERPAFANFYAVAGRFISIESADRQFAELFRHYFAGWHVEAVGGAVAQPDATILIRATGEPPQALWHFESFEVAEGGICRTDASSYFFENNGSAVKADGEHPPRVEVWVGKSPQARERAALARLIFNASMTAMRRCGLFELHAAGVVKPDGAGLLVIGPSGSGKSTLATQLASAGWQYLSDDALLLYSKAEKVRAHALRRVFALTDKSLAASTFEDLESIVTRAEPFDPLKRRFEPRSVFPDRFIETCVPTTLFFSQITNESTSRTRALSRSETMARLIRMCPWACYDKAVAEPHLRVLAELARQARGFELFAGTDLFSDAEYAGNYLLSQTR
jgi:hypothetical protein